MHSLLVKPSGKIDSQVDASQHMHTDLGGQMDSQVGSLDSSMNSQPLFGSCPGVTMGMSQKAAAGSSG